MWGLLALAVLGGLHKNGVAVELRLDGSVLKAVFTPEANLHLYDVDLPKTAEAGRPTRIEVGGRLQAAGPLTADRTSHVVDGLPIYPPGPVTLSLPVKLPTSPDARPLETTVLVTYLACTEHGCLVPVEREPVRIKVPSTRGPEMPDDWPPQVLRAVAAPVHTGAWLVPETRAELERVVDDAFSHGKTVLLDFTGPSCVNCQRMEKGVFRTLEVKSALRDLVAVKVNTDPPHDDLAQFEQESFGTQSRPLYVRFDARGAEQWSEVFGSGDADRLEAFRGFLRGGTGSRQGLGIGLEFWLFAVLGGLVTLLMPCTYPMIPFTLNVFNKQAESGKSVLPLAAFYAAGIVASFTGLGVIVTGVLRGNLSMLSGSPWTNLFIALLFVVLGLGLLGFVELRLPSGVQSLVGGARTGYVGALLMGLTFAVTAFSCTAPFAGSVLAEAVRTGHWTHAVAGMAVYSGAIAVPFFGLAMSPGALRRLPRSGSWMNELKVVGGVVEIAAAVKFLVICDVAWGWGIVGRTFALCVWCFGAAVIALYLSGKLRTSVDEKVDKLRGVRLVATAAFVVAGAWLAFGLAGHDLGVLESFFPAD